MVERVVHIDEAESSILSAPTLRVASPKARLPQGKLLTLEGLHPEPVEGYNNHMAWFVYIARARTGRYYVGITTDPAARIQKHNTGKGSRFAINQGPFTLAYVSPQFLGKSEARKREIQLKGWTRNKKKKLISGELK